MSRRIMVGGIVGAVAVVALGAAVLRPWQHPPDVRRDDPAEQVQNVTAQPSLAAALAYVRPAFRGDTSDGGHMLLTLWALQRMQWADVAVLRPEHTAYVLRALGRLRVPPTERDDLAQEVLLQASRSLDSPLEPRALLFGIARHIVLRWRRKRERDASGARTHLDEIDIESVPDAATLWRAAERAHVVHEAIRELPAMFREVFVRVEIEGMSMPDVAREMGIPVNTGHTRLHLARERFRDAIRRVMARRRLALGDL